MSPQRRLALLVTAVLAGCTAGGPRVDLPDVAGDTAAGRLVAPAAVPEQPYFEFQVEHPVTALQGSCAPAYPDSLRAARTTGEVVGQFIVDTMGMPEIRTFKVLRSSHEAFTTAVREALPCMRFTPARLRGRRVRQLVQQPFVFETARQDD